MDIAVCGAQVPFMRGGAELAMENLVGQLNLSGHRAEVVRLPTVWDRTRILDAALAWRFVPIDADLVIATNFPSYFVRHERKVVWLFHQHRGAYDLFDSPASDFDLNDEALRALETLSAWDVVALEEAKRVFTISEVVAERLLRFNGVPSSPLYHPPPLYERLREGPSESYVFVPTRLERNKRPDVVADALRYCRSDVRAVIAGTGSMRDELSERAKTDGTTERLDLPGFVSDEDLIDYYARCLAVVYAPADEDYGYVTLQAFRAGKPVITAADSGGVLEWVEDGVNGIVTDGSPAQIGKAIDRLAGAPELCARMGAAGRTRVAELSWSPVVEQLLAAGV